jgi:hypothetical protein
MKSNEITILVLLGIVVLLMFTRAISSYDNGSSGGAGGDGTSVVDKGNIIVYGSKTCPWCVKQEEYLKNRGIPYTFVNCPTENCPEFVSGFPTLMINNQVKVGFTEV